MPRSVHASGTGERSVDIFVSSDAGAMGSNLPEAAHLINYDSPMTAMTYEQRIGRGMRPGRVATTYPR